MVCCRFRKQAIYLSERCLFIGGLMDDGPIQDGAGHLFRVQSMPLLTYYRLIPLFLIGLQATFNRLGIITVLPYEFLNFIKA